MNQEEKIQTEYEEIDLMDYVKVIFHRKWFILIIFLGAVIIAGILSWYLPKVYKIDTSLEIGNVGGELIEKPGQLVEKIKGDIYGIPIREKLNIPEKEYPNIKAENPKDTNLITLEIESSKTQQAKTILEEIDNLILKDHQRGIESKKTLIGKDIERLGNKISSLEEEKKNLEAKVDTLQKVLPYRQDPGTQFALLSTKEQLEVKKQEIENLYLQINSNQRLLEDIQPTQIAKIPTIFEELVKPKPVLNIAIAGVLGAFLGVFLAFFQEWWEKNKGRI
jgi:uncharacterized protein involved in exopolysaccharide biosynthesis